MHGGLFPATRRILAFLTIALPALPAVGLPAARPSLHTVRLIVGDGETSVILSADGPLPSPKVGVLDHPPRIYLDFREVRPATDGVRVKGDLLVRAVRVAVHQAQPLVTRVVIDLSTPVPHRIDAGQHGAGQLTIIVGVPAARGAADRPPAAGQAAAAVAPSPPAAPPAAPPAGSAPVAAQQQAGAPPPRAARSPDFVRAAGVAALRAPADDVAQYLRRASPMIERLERLRPVLLSLDALTAVPDEQLQSAAEQFESIRRALEKVAAPGTLAATHGLFRDACALGAAAARARLSPAEPDDAARAWNAAAAAAGTMMLLDRARAELGLPPAQSDRN